MNFFIKKFYRAYLKFLAFSKADDLKYVKVQYFLKNGRHLNIDNPVEFMEKIQWLKLYHYDESYKDFVDKYAVRDFVVDRVGKHILTKIYKVYDNANQIDPNELPEQFILKCTHASGTNILISDRTKTNWPQVKSKLKHWLKWNQYEKSRERVYRNVVPRVIAEELLVDPSGGPLVDYKFYCFHGVPQYVLVKTVENGVEKKCYFDMQWNKVMPEQISSGFLQSEFPQPSNFSAMVDVAKSLSADFIFMRVDLYSVDDKIYFGELTFFPTGGIKRIFVERMNRELGDLISLPK